MNSSGEWASARASTTNGYVVEWDARSLIELPDPLTFMNGDAGADELYGYDGGIDRFIIDTIDAVDSIYNFNVNDHDQLDISNILSFNDKTDDIFDFINLTENAGDTIISIDSDGADNGSTFTDIVRMEDVTGLDLALLVTSDSLLV